MSSFLTATTWHCVDQHILWDFLLCSFQTIYTEEKKITWKSSAQTFELTWSLVGLLSKLFMTLLFSINFRSQIENQLTDYRLLGASSFLLDDWTFLKFIMIKKKWAIKNCINFLLYLREISIPHKSVVEVWVMGDFIQTGFTHL